MKVNRNELRNHLELIYSSGQISKTWFDENMGTAALSDTKRFFVHAPPLIDGEGFEEPFGIRGLSRIVTFLGLSSSDGATIETEERDGEEFVVIGFDTDDDRLSLQDPYEFSLIMPDETIARSIDEDIVPQILSEIDGGEAAELSDELVEQLRSAGTLVEGDRAHFQVGDPGDSSVIQFGTKTGDYTRVPVPVKDEDGPYTLELEREAFFAALANIENPANAELIVTGPESLIAIRENGYTWGIDDLS